jgi:hypothetical protein
MRRACARGARRAIRRGYPKPRPRSEDLFRALAGSARRGDESRVIGRYLIKRGFALLKWGRPWRARLWLLRWLAARRGAAGLVFTMNGYVAGGLAMTCGWQCRSTRELAWMRARFRPTAYELYMMTPDDDSRCAGSVRTLARACARHAMADEVGWMIKKCSGGRARRDLVRVYVARRPP